MSILKPSSNPEKSKVSIIVPGFNREECLDEMIRSGLKPSQKEWELIQVDYGSTDGGGKLVKTFINEFPGRVSFIFPRRSCEPWR